MTMQKSLVLETLLLIPVGLLVSGLSDALISVADPGVPNSEATSSISKSGNSSASATITITMYGVTDE